MQLRVYACGIAVAFSLLASPAIASIGVKDNTKTSSYKDTKLITVTKTEFGVFRRSRKGKMTFIPTTNVPLLDGYSYGWRIHFKKYKGKVTWREILQLPKVPETWGTQNGENFSLSPDGSAAITSRTDYVENSMIQNTWAITTGDPLGKHRIDVFIDGRRVARFNFDVMAASK
jgi:hypothetical protein